jgi:hypothetical protein
MTDNYSPDPECEALVAIQAGEWDTARRIVAGIPSADREAVVTAAGTLANMCLTVNQPHHVPANEPTTSTDQISDGYHTFGELYEHRTLLFVALMRAWPQLSWFAQRHDDGSAFPGFFIAGMHLPTGQITYHLEDRWLPLLRRLPIVELAIAPQWDGHASSDVVRRLTDWLAGT